MKGPDPRRAAQDSVRDQLRAAARRELAGPARQTHARRRFRRRWRGAGLAVIALLGVSVAAGATDLISVGEPLPDTTVNQPRYAPPGAGLAKLVVKAPDPDSGLAWGAGIYTSSTGQDCVIAGQVRGVSLGRVRDGRFRPYAKGTTGACGDLDRLPALIDVLSVDGRQPRTVVFGRAAGAARSVSINDDGTRRSAAPGPGGAFVFVLRGALSHDGLDFKALDLRVEP